MASLNVCEKCRQLRSSSVRCPVCGRSVDNRSPEALLGEVLGGWTLEGVLGAGATGVVYRARGPEGRPAAVKLMLPDDGDPTAEKRFLREARTLDALRHPRIVEVFECAPSGWGTPFIAMELLEGPSLRDLIRKHPGGLPPPRALGHLRRIAETLAFAHAQGVVHRDLKPENVLITGGDDAPEEHILDFGFARIVQSARETRLTTTGMLLGTPNYMATEQVQGSEVGPPADQYALALIAAELLTGRKVRAGCTLAQVVIEEVIRPVPAERLAGLPPAAVEALRRGTDPDPARRWPDVTALVAALDAAYAAPAPADVSTLELPAPRPQTRRSPLPWVLAAAALLAAAAVLLLALRAG